MEIQNEDNQVRLLYYSLLKNWNDKSAAGFAELFMENGNAIGFDGSPMNGWKEIIDELSKIFIHHETPLYTGIIKEVRPLGTDVYLLRAVAGMTPRGKAEIDPAVNTMQMLIAQKENGRFRIAVFQNTPAAFHGRKEMAEQLTKELQAEADSKKQAG